MAKSLGLQWKFVLDMHQWFVTSQISSLRISRHCEERSDEAVSRHYAHLVTARSEATKQSRDCFAALAMT